MIQLRSLALVLAIAGTGCGVARSGSVSEARALDRYERAARALDGDFFEAGRNARYCWARGVEGRCEGDTPADSEAARTLRACVARLAAANDRPGRKTAFDRLERCMNDAGWFRHEWFEMTIGWRPRRSVRMAHATLTAPA